MRQTTALYDSLLASGNMEIQIICGDLVFGMSDITGCTMSGGLVPDSLSIGNCMSSEMNVTLMVSDSTVIPRMAELKLQIRLNNGTNSSEWLNMGTFFIDTRDTTHSGILTISSYDAMLKAESTWVDESYDVEWPMPVSDALEDICDRLGVELDIRSELADFDISYPNDYTMREVLSHIAVANGGNWIISSDNELRFVQLKTGGSCQDLALTIGSFSTSDEFDPVGEIVIEDANEDQYVSGGSEYSLTGFCPWATQDIADYVLGQLGGYVYRPFSAGVVILNPAIELGDYITIDGTNFQIFDWSWKFTKSWVAQIAAENDDEVDHEYPYESSDIKEISRKVSTNSSYEGVTITRSDGLTIERTDGSAKVVLNSHEFTFYVNGVKVLYFDPTSYTYRFVGDVQIDSGSINIGNAFIVDQNGNLSTYGNADLHGGTLTTTNGDVSVGVSNEGLKLMGTGELLKAMLGYNTADGTEYPYLLLGAGGGSSDTSGLVKKFWNGVWIGNSAPMNATGEFVAQSGYNGIFFNFSDDKAYIVNGANMQNVYTGEAIARFG